VASEGSVVPRRAYETLKLETPPEDPHWKKVKPLVPTTEHLDYAVVQCMFKQYIMREGNMYDVTFIRALPGSKLRLNRVMLHKGKKDGSDEFEVTLGKPFIDGAYVEITILEHLKTDEKEYYKHRAKKHQQKRFINQYKLTRFRVDKIVLGDPSAPIQGKPVHGIRKDKLWTEEKNLPGPPEGWKAPPAPKYLHNAIDNFDNDYVNEHRKGQN